VERRRRETINEGINEIAKIVPGSEKNKGAILQTAVSYIMHLKSTQEDTIEKRTMEKVVMDQALSELSSSNEELKASLKDAWTEIERLRNRLRDSGLDLDDAPGAGGGHAEG
jgi:bHLH factor